jgi:hypothetical protein
MKQQEGGCRGVVQATFHNSPGKTEEEHQKLKCRCTDRDSNHAHPEYTSKALLFEPTCSVWAPSFCTIYTTSRMRDNKTTTLGTDIASASMPCSSLAYNRIRGLLSSILWLRPDVISIEIIANAKLTNTSASLGLNLMAVFNHITMHDKR